MNELSIEEKAKRYDEVIAMAKECVTSIHDDAVNKYMLNMFPELKESEDERIRKALIEMVHDTTGDELWVDYNVHKEDALAWLKKQGEYYPKKDVDDAYLQGICDAKQELEKQGEQKPADKVELKFKVGDCVKHNITKEVFFIKDIGNVCSYYMEDIVGETEKYPTDIVDELSSLWTIQDAKPGDVLYCDNSNNKTIYLFKEQRGSSNIANAYFQILNMNDEQRLMVDKAADFNLHVKLATKEQRDLLFQKMKEAGYEWDAEKKELKRIE